MVVVAAAGRGGAAATTGDVGVYAGDLGAATPDGSGQRSKEWFRPNPDPGDVVWGPRANTNIQESALLFALHNAGEERQRFLSDYWIKSKNSVNRGINGPIRGWVLPASQHSKENVAEAINELMDQGLEFSVANADFKAGNVQVHKGDWVIRGDQPFRGVADIYFSIQNYPTTNPAPYDDTGWSYQMMRNLTIEEVRDSSFLAAPMTKVSGHVVAAGGISGAGSTGRSWTTRATTCWSRSGSSSPTRRCRRRKRRSMRPVTTLAPARSSSPTRIVRRWTPPSSSTGWPRGPWTRCRASRRMRCRCPASATSTAGRARRTKAGSAARSTITRFLISISARTSSTPWAT